VDFVLDFLEYFGFCRFWMKLISEGRNNSREEMAHSTDTAAEVTREGILHLIKRRQDIDEQIQALGGILQSNHVGMSEALVDVEGFPRNDIDVFQVRHARHKIICLQNDFKSLTKEIDENLQLYHQRLKERGVTDAMMDMNVESVPEPEKTPIAKVNLVSEGSPAFHAGVLVDDLVMEFGSINSTNFTNLTDIGALVQRMAGNCVTVKVKRDGRIVKLALIPGPWSGRGLLGCNVVPFDSIDR